MRTLHLFAGAVATVLAASCASIPQPSAEARQALAPTGKLRVALFEGNAVHAIRDPATGRIIGVSHDLGEAMAASLGVPFEPVLYKAFPALLDAGKAGAWDVAFMGNNPDRQKTFDFAGDHLDVEIGYLVPPGSRFSTASEVDAPGVRVAVVARGSPDVLLSQTLRHASLVRVPGLDPALELVRTGKADALGGLKPSMYGVVPRVAGARVLDGRSGTESQGLALPKGRSAEAAGYARRFLENAKASGQVKAAMERAGLRGVVVASRD